MLRWGIEAVFLFFFKVPLTPKSLFPWKLELSPKTLSVSLRPGEWFLSFPDRSTDSHFYYAKSKIKSSSLSFVISRIPPNITSLLFTMTVVCPFLPVGLKPSIIIYSHLLLARLYFQKSSNFSLDWSWPPKRYRLPL